jgi:hypothetical protein
MCNGNQEFAYHALVRLAPILHRRRESLWLRPASTAAGLIRLAHLAAACPDFVGLRDRVPPLLTTAGVGRATLTAWRVTLCRSRGM